ncbi:hypothetical protein Tter_1337 [Thermobaculum terrenum ATCC BAA-798]|uniref:Uncharacterized protein n=1 Tax=Thermobaculum terrenum (strain ATCC BAA-798 / CCMEE 7001 / YNP1) TaxID=525904 RepID=D1CBS9_THET1|nr:hypothetical protein Tter_1337 [Thermobaculum terrenum ATCC BAA-798]
MSRREFSRLCFFYLLLIPMLLLFAVCITCGSQAYELMDNYELSVFSIQSVVVIEFSLRNVYAFQELSSSLRTLF